MKKSLLVGIGLLLLITAGLAVHRNPAWFAAPPPAPDLGSRPPTPAERLRPPDALLMTQSLAQLPRDLRQMPLFQEVFTEDWFFYYEQNPNRLSLEGTLRRIAFEHRLSFPEQVLAQVFDTPAQMALWKAPDGSLGRYLLVVERGGLLRTLEQVARLALDDAQLKPAGTLDLAPGKPPVYELRHAPRRSLLFVSLGDSLLIASERDLLFNGDDPAQRQIAAWLAAPAPRAAMLATRGLEGAAGRHSLALSARYLSFGYQRFFPALEALRLEFDQGRWGAWLRTTGDLPPARELWRALPTGAALCAALPLGREPLEGLLGRFLEADEAAALSQSLEPPAALCWYPGARLHAPLLVARTRAPVPDASLKRLFAAHVGTHEAGIPPPTPAADATPAARPPAPKTYLPPLPVTETALPDGLVLRREVSARQGSLPRTESADADRMRSREFFPVTLARRGNLLLFSPDGRLVDNALATLDKRYPALADRLPPDMDLALLVYPDGLAALARATVLDNLPESVEDLFRASVSARLLPALEQIQQWPAQGLRTPGTHGWEAARWHTLAGP